MGALSCFCGWLSPSLSAQLITSGAFRGWWAVLPLHVYKVELKLTSRVETQLPAWAFMPEFDRSDLEKSQQNVNIITIY